MVPLNSSSKNLQIEATFQGRTTMCNQLVHERKAYSLILASEGEHLQCKLVRWRDEKWMDAN